MNNVLEKPRQTIIGSIFETYNYDLFKTLEGNRELNDSNLRKLRDSFDIKFLLSPICINSNFEIIDGQHRFQVSKEKKLPIRYYIDYNADLKTVQLMNSKSKKWDAYDYMDSYCKLGNEHYLKYKKFYEKYNLNHITCQLLLSTSSEKGHKGFNDGIFEINRWNFACKVAESVNIIKEYCDFATQRSLVNAIMEAHKIKGFEIKKLIDKIKKYPFLLRKCADRVQYTDMLEELYNYRNRNKLNFRI